ncbi:MAG TPA: hypothetical protein VG538_11440 [Vicinamibacterales bacterium]|jgi:hypothetical protein|nr:hypothetical protein [Vicinamibacterales bacterium]
MNQRRVTRPNRRRHAVSRPRRRTFARLLAAARRQAAVIPPISVMPAVEAFDRHCAMTPEDLRRFGAVIQESFDAGHAVGARYAREFVRDQTLVIMRYFAGCGLSLCLDPLWALLVFIRVPLDHTAIAADIERTVSPTAAASYLEAATEHFSRHSPDDTVSRQ